MSDRAEFCLQLRERLHRNTSRVLLRVAIAPDFEHPIELTGQQILEKAEALASSISFAKERSVVLILLPHALELFLLQLGLVLKGHLPAILPWPTNRIDAEKYQRNLLHQLSHLPADHLITSPSLCENLAATLPYAASAVPVQYERVFTKIPPISDLDRSVAAIGAKHHAAFTDGVPGDDALFLQFSGGTTGAQKAIVVTAQMLSEQLRTLGKALHFTEDDSVVSWLPMYHDMGLIACFWLPLWHGAASTQIAVNDWLLNPELLLKYISSYRATFCWLPNFAFSYLAQRREFMRHTHALSSVRAWINCSEPVRQKSMNDFVAAFADWGVSSESMQACYAMAETVFAITQSQLGKKLRTVSRSAIQRAGHSDASLSFDLLDADYVSSGKPLENTGIRIVAADGSVCADAVAGEIYVRAPWLFSGYWSESGFQKNSLRDGWHATGDYGFAVAGELFVIGRLKDIIIVGGNNIFPEDVEAVVNPIPGVYPGRVVAFGVDDAALGTQSLAVTAEMREFDASAASDLEATIRKLVLTAIGTAPRYVAVVPSPWIVKSTAGKIARRETRERFLREKSCVPAQR
jgi:fatty-acyl-CoA synthase